MEMNRHSETVLVLLGAVTSTVLGSILLQGLGALILGILGALGGYIFNKYLKQRLDGIARKIKGKDKAV